MMWFDDSVTAEQRQQVIGVTRGFSEIPGVVEIRVGETLQVGGGNIDNSYSLGAWSKSIISITGLAVMLSTVLVLLDGYPRSIAVLIHRFRRAEIPAELASDQSNLALFACALFAVGYLYLLAA